MSTPYASPRVAVQRSIQERDGGVNSQLRLAADQSAAPGSDAFVGVNAELLQFAMQRAAFHADELGGAADIATEA